MTLSDALPTIEWDLVASHFFRLLVAYALAVPVAWERERHSRGAGLRTFPLTAMGSCGFVLIGIDVLEGSEALARVFYGLMTGIGFIGGGAILKDNGSVRGAATAASIWGTGVIGAAIAYGRYEIAIIVSLLTFLLLRGLQPVKDHLSQDDDDHP